MSRRKPVLRHAVVPMGDGEDEARAVLRKASRLSAASLAEQLAAEPDAMPRLGTFMAGYAVGYARHQALKHGVDAEAGEGALMGQLREELLAAASGALAEAIGALRFLPRANALPGARAAISLAPAPADAGYLVGHLESLSGTRRLARQLVALSGAEATADDFLTACDVAADPMQTRQPTLSLRFDPAERAVVREAFGALQGR